MVELRTALLLIWFSLQSSLTRAAPSIADLSSSNNSSPFTPLDDTTQPSTAFPVNSDANVTTIKNTTVLIQDRDGVDITTSFQIKVYNPRPPKQITNMSEINQLNERQTEPAIQLINRCPGDNMVFKESHCTPHEHESMPMQSYKYICEQEGDLWRWTTGEYMGRTPLQKRFNGTCPLSYMCVDGFGDMQIASCVQMTLFTDFEIQKDGTLKGMLGQEVFDVGKAWMFLSQNDPDNAAIAARKMGIDAWNSASMATNVKTQRKTCVNCMELETGLLKSDTDSLRLEAKLMSAGAIGGILWLALSAG